MSLDKQKLEEYIQLCIMEFHDSRIARVREQKLDEILKRKNPYLFKAKNIETAADFVRSILDAYLSSQEETLFGTFVERLAVYVCAEVKCGGKTAKSCADGIDMEFTENGVRYLISVKSGPNWGNSSQIDNMKKKFKAAIKRFHTQNPNEHIVCVNGCCYGKDSKPDKGDYYKYCGETFWEFISGDKDFYLKIIDPLSHAARAKNDYFKEEYNKALNKFTREFIEKYCDEDGAIEWDKLLKFVSEKPPEKEPSQPKKRKKKVKK